MVVVSGSAYGSIGLLNTLMLRTGIEAKLYYISTPQKCLPLEIVQYHEQVPARYFYAMAN